MEKKITSQIDPNMDQIFYKDFRDVIYSEIMNLLKMFNNDRKILYRLKTVLRLKCLSFKNRMAGGKNKS